MQRAPHSYELLLTFHDTQFVQLLRLASIILERLATS